MDSNDQNKNMVHKEVQDNIIFEPNKAVDVDSGKFTDIRVYLDISECNPQIFNPSVITKI